MINYVTVASYYTCIPQCLELVSLCVYMTIATFFSCIYPPPSPQLHPHNYYVLYVLCVCVCVSVRERDMSTRCSYGPERVCTKYMCVSGQYTIPAYYSIHAQVAHPCAVAQSKVRQCTDIRTHSVTCGIDIHACRREYYYYIDGKCYFLFHIQNTINQSDSGVLSFGCLGKPTIM